MNTQLFVDESKSRDYLLVASCELSTRLAATRAELQRLLLPNQRRIHFTNERDGRRRQILARLVQLDIRTTIYQAPRGMDQLKARQLCMERLAQDAISLSAQRIVFERDDSLLIHDKRILQPALRGPDGRALVRYEHLRAYEESLLWPPDAVAWSWAKGGHWRTLVRPIIDQVIKL